MYIINSIIKIVIIPTTSVIVVVILLWPHQMSC